MVILAQSSNSQNCIKKTNVIPEYARDYKNEYLFIRGINKEFKYFVENIKEATRGLFQNHRVDRIKKFIKKFVLAQKLGYLNDVSNFEIKSSDVDYLIKIKKNFDNFNQYIQFCKDCYDDDQIFIDPYPGLKNIYDDYELFCSKFKIKYEDGGSFGIIILIARVRVRVMELTVMILTLYYLIVIVRVRVINISIL